MEEREETRKIQFTGKSSYIVSLPKQWIMDLGLKQGDQIRMVRKGSSTLELFPPKFGSRSQKKEEAVIEINSEDLHNGFEKWLIVQNLFAFQCRRYPVDSNPPLYLRNPVHQGRNPFVATIQSLGVAYHRGVSLWFAQRDLEL